MTYQNNTHLPCDSCGSSDAVTEYEKNYFCFSCKKSTRKLRSSGQNYNRKPLSAPTVQDLSSRGMDYLKRYYIDIDLAAKHNIKTTHYLGERISLEVAPGVSEFKTIEKIEPKVISTGSKKIPFINNIGHVNGLVIVEDILSAIRVGDHVSCLALRGTAFKHLLSCLSEHPSTSVIVWLDGDQAGKSAAKKLVKYLTIIGKQCYNVSTPLDPKEYTDEEIKNTLKKNIEL